ncbi:hypothetical protein [Lacrimispora sp.]|uniref:hypothetical protein n=1 Tax=Lacrimispora sp. TaxID=2719234 RepID=UPI0039955D80
MAETKLNLILDGGSYKISYSIGGKQQKATIGNEKIMSLLAARNISNEIEDILDAKYSMEILEKMHRINEDAIKCGRNGRVIKYQNRSIELAMKIMYTDLYDEWFEKHQKSINDVLGDLMGLSPLEILNVGCTAAGKTRFILGVILSAKGLKNFVPSLTSIKETTACFIIYHINSLINKISDDKNFCVEVELKNRDELIENIKGLIIEAAEEYIESIKNKSKDEENLDCIRKAAILAVSKRLEMNYDKTFGLGQRKINVDIANEIEKLMMIGMMEFYGDSKSISRNADTDEAYIIKQLIIEFNKNGLAMGSDDIFKIVGQYEENGSLFIKIVDEVFRELMDDLDLFKKKYEVDTTIGQTFCLSGNSEDPSTLELVSHIFGNKGMQRLEDFYCLEPLLKSAEFYFNVENLKSFGREIIMTDSVGINQGQKDSARLKEIVTNRVQEAIQRRKPEIIIYHTRILTNDDYMLDIIKNLNMQGYGKKAYIVAGRLDTVFQDRVTTDGLEIGDIDESYFREFIEEVHHTYIENDSATLNTIIEDRYLVCDKTNSLGKRVVSASEYHSDSVFKQIIQNNVERSFSVSKYNDVNFVEFLESNFICSNVYKQYLAHIPEMIPLNYNKMRWNTLQKAIEILFYNGFGFDVLYPAINVKNFIAVELSKDETKSAFEKMFGEDAEAIKRRYLIEVADAAQIVLVSEYRTFMSKLLRMRYDNEFRTDLSTTMTNDRKYNLQRLYSTCLEREGLHGEYTLMIVFRIAWIRTQQFFEILEENQ